jgi:hypothetical protein
MANNKFHVEGVARRVPLDTLYDFYTDYSPEDVEIMRKHGQKMALERVSKREGDHVVVDTTAKIMGMTKNMRYDILLHPEAHWYEMELSVDGLFKSHRTYKFKSVEQGTQILIDDEYEPTSFLARMMNAMGMLKKRIVRDTINTMNAFVAEAEERFGEKTTGGQQVV